MNKFNKIEKIDVLAQGLYNNREKQDIEYKIRTSASTHEIQDILRYVNDKELVLPDMQREEGAWNLVKKRDFIDSLIFNYPIPPMMVLKHNNLKMLIDGQQRMACIRDFFNGDFKTKVSQDKSISNKKYSDLSIGMQKSLLQREVLIQNIQQEYPNGDSGSFIYEIFRRINTGSAKLNSMDVRFASYYGDFSKWFKKWCMDKSKEENFILYKESYSTIAEMFLRGLAFSHLISWNQSEHKIFFLYDDKKITTIKLDYLYDNMMELLCWNQSKKDAFEQSKNVILGFEKLLNRLISICGMQTLKSVGPDGLVKSKIQMPALDVILLALTTFGNSTQDMPIFKKKLKTLLSRNKILASNNYSEYKKIFQERTLHIDSILKRLEFIFLDDEK